jgi:hypothetical protein
LHEVRDVGVTEALTLGTVRALRVELHNVVLALVADEDSTVASARDANRLRESADKSRGAGGCDWRTKHVAVRAIYYEKVANVFLGDAFAAACYADKLRRRLNS